MAASTSLRFSDFVDLLLARLYELEREHGPDKFFSLHALASEFKEPIPPKWVFDAGKVMEARGLASCLFMVGGHVASELTGEGRMHVEERRREKSGIIAAFAETPGNFVVVSGDRNQVVVGSPGARSSSTIEEERRPAFELIDRIEGDLDEDETLGEQEKKDFLSDVATIRRQLEKREPNRVVLASLLEPLSHVGSIASSVANLITLINI